MIEITIEWEIIQRRRTKIDVPDDMPHRQITELAMREVRRGRAGKLDTILADSVASLGWTAADGRFGGQIR